MKYRKLVLGLLILAIMVSGLAAIKALTANNEPEVKMLIVFYSHTGNAKFVSEHIQTLTGADVFELKPVEPYSEDFSATAERAGREREEGKLPALSGKIDNFAAYDVIFLGSPNWFGTLSLPVMAFLDSYDLSGKTVVPFIAFGRGGLQNTITDLKELAPNANFLEAFGVSRDDVSGSQPAITEWLERIGIIK